MISKLHKKTSTPKKETSFTCNNIVNISENTTEKIEDKYLIKFLTNTIHSNQTPISYNSKLFYTYFEKNNIYEIFFIQSISNKDLVFPFIFSEIHKSDENELFIYNQYFTIYSKGEFQLFKKITTEISASEILDFIKHRYEIIIDTIHKFEDKDIEELKTKYLQNKEKNKPQLISLKKDNSLRNLLSYSLFILLIPLIHYNFLFEDKTNYKTDKKLISLEKNYQNLMEKKDKKKTDKIIQTLLQIKNFSLNLHSININKNKMYIFLESKQKINLLEFVDMNEENIKINNLKYDQKNKTFNMEALIVLQ